MEASQTGSFTGSLVENRDQLDRVERPDEISRIERQESMFDEAEFDETGYEDQPLPVEDTSFDEPTGVSGSAEVEEDAIGGPVAVVPDEAEDSLPVEAPDEAHYASLTGAALDNSAQGSAAQDGDDTPKALTVDDFAALEERVLKAVSLVRREREARMAAEERLQLIESQMLAQAPAVEQLRQEIDSLRAEREQVRQRVERLLSQLDALEL